MNGGMGSNIPWPSKSCSAFQTYPKRDGESLEDFNTRVMKSDTIYGNSPAFTLAGRFEGAKTGNEDTS